MTRILAAATLVSLLYATPASADTITWFASNQVYSVSPYADFFVGPGLTVGTPWSLQVSFDPGAPPVRTLSPGCNQYAVSSSTLTLGSFSYTNSGGSIYTNAELPAVGCIGGTTSLGQVAFWYSTAGWHTDDPAAWRLANWGGITYAAYYDQLVADGTLPATPIRDPHQGRYSGFEIENDAFLGTLIYGGQVNFQLLDEQPSPVPEPATLLMVGTGLAWIARRRRRGC